MKFEQQQIAAYYNQNTNLFMRFGGSGENLAAIHRQVWAPGILTAGAAFDYLNHRVAQVFQKPQPLHLLDLGCGIGGTSTFAAGRLGANVTGVTLSENQVQAARQRADKMGLGDRCRFLAADFLNLPDLGPFDGAWAIESYSHAKDPSRFFEQAARVLKPGGCLVIADDFLASDNSHKEAQTWLDTFRQGWKLSNLNSLQTSKNMASQAGFRLREEEDLSPYLRYAPEWLMRLASLGLKLPIRSSFWESLAGSTALQICGRNGWTKYQWVVWERN